MVPIFPPSIGSTRTEIQSHQPYATASQGTQGQCFKPMIVNFNTGVLEKPYSATRSMLNVNHGSGKPIRPSILHNVWINKSLPKSKAHKGLPQMFRNIEKENGNGNTLWTNAVEKQMKNVCIAFSITDKEAIPNGYQYINCHMIPKHTKDYHKCSKMLKSHQ